MRKIRIADQQDTAVARDGHPLTELWESFTNSFAYDRFQWISLPPASRVNFRPLIQKPEAEGNSGVEADPTGITVTNHDIPIYTTGQVVPFEGDAGLLPATSTSGPLVAVDDFRADTRFAGIDGSGYAIAVLDTGIDLDDPFFGSDANGDGISDRIVYQYDFADGDANASDYSGHGSNVTSIAASSDSTYTGMAPDADIIALKVFTDSGSGNFAYLEKALQWVIANAAAYNIVSVNMSITDGGNYDTPVQLYGIGDELATLAAMDVVVVSASGNSFYQVNSIQGVAYPSADPNSLSVGAVYEGSYGKYSYSSGAVAYSTGADSITPFSQRDDELSDVFAPGAPITGAGKGSGLVTMHGTSQAAPHIAGIVALAQELAVQTLGRKLTYDEITQLLVSSGDSIFDGDDENDNVANTGQTFARLNVLALGEAILAMAGPEPLRDPTYFEVAAVEVSQPEGDSGSTSFTFALTRSGDLSAADTIDYAVTGSGSDPADSADFLGSGLPRGSITFDVGETSRTVTIEVTGDIEVEPDEGFTLTIGNVPPNGQVLVAGAETRIENDDAAPAATSFAIAAADAAKAEGDAGTTAFTFTVTRSGDTSLAGSVDYAVGGTGVDGADFVGGVLPSGTVTFLAGETSKTLTITVAGDTVFESDEAFTVTLTNPSAGSAITTASAGGIILNDDIFNDVRVVLFGTKSADVIDVGAEGLPHEIDALQGNDSVTGTAFDDLITGGKGRDTLIGDAGDDTFLVSGTGDGEDLIYGGDGYDVILGSAGKDTIYLRGLTASHSIEEINGGGGVNTLAGSSGSDVLDLSGTLLVNIDLVDGGKGHDHIIGTAFDDLIMGGPGRDTLIGGAGDDTFLVSGTGDGVDLIYGGDGYDVILGSAGNDTIYLRGLTASQSIEETNGGGGFNTLAGSSGSDVLDLSGTLLVNIDLVDGGKGHDHIIGTAFDDLIMGGPGRDTLIGGGGIDTAIYSGNINSYKIAVDGNQATVVDLIGKEATDYLTDFSYLQFSDATFDLTGGSGIASSEALARTVSNGEGSPLTFDDVLESGTGPASDGGREATALANNYDPLAPVNLNLSGDELLSAAGF
jgi:hypothetical protein